MKRREFVKYTAATAGALTLSPFANIFADEVKKKYANDIVTLGKTGIKVSRLAMGTGTHGVNRSSNQSRGLGVKGVGELLNYAYSKGINFWDSADQYVPYLLEPSQNLPPLPKHQENDKKHHEL